MPTIRIPNGNITVEIELTNAEAQEILNELTQVAGADVGDVVAKDINGNAVFAAPQGGGESNSASFSGSFVNADLVNGELIITHGLNQSIVHLTMKDNNGKRVNPDVEFVDANTVKVYMSPFENLIGTWEFLVTK
jgi:hypothetical protein